jgi:hypothetical protein
MRKIKELNGFEEGSNNVIIVFHDGTSIEQYHEQDCCENVYLAQVDGDPKKHIGATILDLQEKESNASDDVSDNSGTWTFYTMKTSAGYLDWRWLGESNGYYSERVECNFIER